MALMFLATKGFAPFRWTDSLLERQLDGETAG